MTDYVTSLIRTGVPVVAGIILTWLATRGLTLDGATGDALATLLQGVLTALYYVVSRGLEVRFPQLGFLLGISKTPTYK